MMIGFGLVMLVPAFGGGPATSTAGLSARADAGNDPTGLSLALHLGVQALVMPEAALPVLLVLELVTEITAVGTIGLIA